MRTLYIDCGMGAAGDMLSAALIELLPSPDGFIGELNALGIPGVEYVKEDAVKCGIGGTYISVRVHGEEEYVQDHEYHDGHDHHDSHGYHDGHDHHDDHEHHSHHHHSSMHDIEQIVASLHLPTKVEQDVLAVYRLIAEAESYAHKKPVTEIHFHEVGAMDAIADITAVCMLMARIAPDNVVASPVHVGSGQVHCAHGILPVPAPATAYILRDVPIYGGEIRGELCTPTGAALLKHFVSEFGPMPRMKVSKIGYGMGRKDFPAANCVRAMLGESEDKQDVIVELNCNVDDMTPEHIGFAMERLFEAGAQDVFTIPIGMKKNRPGTLIRVICREETKNVMVELLMKHTTTLGIRETICKRHVLSREQKSFQTSLGEVRRKDASGYGVNRSKYEYEDLAKIAREQNMSLADVERIIDRELGGR